MDRDEEFESKKNCPGLISPLGVEFGFGTDIIKQNRLEFLLSFEIIMFLCQITTGLENLCCHVSAKAGFS